MTSQNIILFAVLILSSSIGFTAVNSADEKLMEELSGRQKIQAKSKPLITLPNSGSLAERHLFAGLDAFKVKNYILALKHYNTVIFKHSKSREVKSAFLAKAKLYTEIGLQEQAQLNSKLALQQGYKITK